MAKLKRVNLAEKHSEVTISKPKKVHYPTLYLHKKLPLKPEDIGKVFNATVQLKFTGMSTNTGEDRDSSSYDLEVHEIVFNK